MGYHSNLEQWLKLKKKNAAEDMEKRESMHILGGTVNKHISCGKQYGGSSKYSKCDYPVIQSFYL
jgi:hypothetical protein